MRERLGRWLTNADIDAVLARRDVLVGILNKHIAAKGEAAVLCRSSPSAGPSLACCAGRNPDR